MLLSMNPRGIKVLSIGMDKDLLKKGSPSFERHQVYAQHVEALHTVIFARKEYGRDVVQIADNAWAHPTYSSNVLGLFYDAFRIGKRLLKEKGNWVISAQDPFESGLVAYLLARVTKTPFMIQEHGDFFSERYWREESFTNRMRYKVGTWLLPRADHVRVVSKRIAKTVQTLGVDKDRITIHPVHTDVQSFQNAEPSKEVQAQRGEARLRSEPELQRGKGEDDILILSIGRFVPQKNLGMLVRAFTKVLERGVHAKLLLYGKGSEEGMLRELANDAPVGSIVFREWTDNPASVMRAVDIYALPSNYEGWGRVCIETLASGVPLLMTDVGCAGEIVFDGVNGLVVPIDDEWVFTEGLYKLATDATLRKLLKREGQATVEQLPTFEANVALYIESLQKTAEK